jgi:hypothetical protein
MNRSRIALRLRPNDAAPCGSTTQPLLYRLKRFLNGLEITKIPVLDYEIADFGDSGVIDTAVLPTLLNNFKTLKSVY